TYATPQKDNPLGNNNPNPRSDGVRLEKELINCGLKKLVTSYNATTGHNSRQLGNKKKTQSKEKSKYDPRFRRFLVHDEKSYVKSQSEISIVPKRADTAITTSTPIFPSKKTSDLKSQQIRHGHDNKFTMTKTGSYQDHGAKLRKHQLQRPVTAAYAEEIKKGYPPLHMEYTVNQQSIDPRLCQKYSILKLPWKRSWTIPVFSHKSSIMNGLRNADHIDRQTYLYDDGTEIDSAYADDKQKQIISSVFQSQFVGILFLVGSLCGILLVSLLIWFIFGFDFFHIFFKRRDIQEAPIRRYVKYVGGGTMHLITNLFRILRRVLTTPTQQVYQVPPNRYGWPHLRNPQIPDE
ncbi:hypothetical protein NQ315_009869, partial [Exocentrus adspersus]